MKQNQSRGISVTQLANAWGCSRGNISRCIKKGMPMTSREAADEWRHANATRGIGYRSKGKPAAQENPDGGIADAGSDENPNAALPNEGRGEDAGKHGSSRIKFPKPTKLLKTLASSLRASIQVESESLRLVEEAQATGDRTLLALRIAAYNKAKEGRMQSEKFVTAFNLERQTLITWDEAVEMASRLVIPLVTRLRSIPRRTGALANPSDDVKAEKVIAEEIEAAIKEVQALFSTAVTPLPRRSGVGSDEPAAENQQ